MSNETQKAGTAEIDAGAALIDTARAIFGGGVRSFILDDEDSTVVHIKTARMGQLKIIIKFFTTLMTRFNDAQLKTVIEFVSEQQMIAITQGKDPKGVEIDWSSLIGRAFGNASLIHTMAISVLDEIPEVVEAFTTLTPEQLDNLELDQVILIVGGIFVTNYGFFTQRVAPVLRLWFAGLAREKGLIESKPPENERESEEGKPQKRQTKAKP